MAFSKRRQVMRYDRLRERQPTTAWTEKYEAGIRATRDEGSPVTRPTRISSRNRFGRTLHAGSIPERTAILLALYCPEVFALLEQFSLCPRRSPHPMSGHPRFAGMELGDLPGTVPILDGLGELDRHPLLRIRNVQGEIEVFPDLYVADLILAIQDANGPFCVHWTIKVDADGFLTPFASDASFRDPDGQKEKFDLRMRIDHLYFGAAGISTRDFAASDIDLKVVANMMRCFEWSIREGRVIQNEAKLKALLRSTDLASATPHQLSIYCHRKMGIEMEDFKRVLYAMVWRRELRVDLFRPLLFDMPWRKEVRDVLDVYAAYFRR